MARLTMGEMFSNVRGYLDTDELNFPDDLLNMLLQRLWFQAVTMEREWRFFQRQGETTAVAGNPYVPMSFDNLTVVTPAVRLLTVLCDNVPLAWRESSDLMTAVLASQGDGQPVYYSEVNDGPQRNIVLYPPPVTDCLIEVEFFAEPVYPVVNPGAPDQYGVTFADLPDEFDQALQEGLIAEMYMREEDPDLYDVHRNMFLEQMGSIRNRWKESLYTPIIVAGRAVLPTRDRSGFDDMGRFTQPAAR